MDEVNQIVQNIQCYLSSSSKSS